MSDYLIKTKGEERGPYAESQLRSMWNNGAITSDTLYRETEAQEWRPIAGFFETEKPAAVQVSPIGDEPASATPNKSQAGAIAVLIVLILVIAAMFFGNVHIITGRSLE